MNGMVFGGLILSLLISPVTTEALRDCSKFQDGFRNALESAVRKTCDDIEEEDLENLETLDLSGKNLDDFYSSELEVFEKLEDLRFLDLSNNQIHDLPKEIWAMRKLEELNISGNPIFFVPWDRVRDLRRLDRMDYSETHILTSIDHSNRMAVISPLMLYKTGK